MALPIRTQILQAIKANLDAISPATDPIYRHTMQEVYIAQADKPVNGIGMPAAVIVLDGIDEVTERWSCGKSQHTMVLSIFSAYRPDPGDPEFSVEEIQRLASDVHKAIDDDIQLGALALYCEVAGDEWADSPAEDIYWAETKVRVGYFTALGDPTAVS